MEKFGIENLKKVLIFGVNLGKKISDSMDDKKFSLSEILALIPDFAAIPDFIAKKDDILNEAKDLSLEEIKQLIAIVEGQINDNDVVGIIEDSLNFIVAGKNLVERFTKKTETPAVA